MFVSSVLETEFSNKFNENEKTEWVSLSLTLVEYPKGNNTDHLRFSNN